MTDDAYERLAQRNAELMEEKAVLVEEVESLNEHIEALQEKQVAETCACSHDYPADVCLGHSPMYRKMRDERDALAAHVERLHAKIDECYGDPGRMHLEAGNIRDQGPQTSLSLLKAQWQAEALEAMAARLWPVGMIGKGVERDAILLRAEELRRQAEADTAGECLCTFAQKTVGDGCAACNPELPSNWEVDYVHPGPDR